MTYFIIGAVCIVAGYIIGTFATAFIMKQKVVSKLTELDALLMQKGDAENEEEKE